MRWSSLCSGVREEPYNGLAARSAAKEQSLTSQGSCASRVLELQGYQGRALDWLVLTTTVCAAMTALALAQPETGSGGDPTILVSRQLRESEGLSIGEVVSLSSDADGSNPRRFRIAGEYEPMADPMRLGAVRHEVRLHLPDLIAITADPADPLALESVDAINVAVAGVSDRQRFVRDLVARTPGIVVSVPGGGRAEPFVVLERFHLAIAVVTVVASSIFLLALMLMLVDERRTTVGILRLIGVRRRRIALLVLAEGVVIAVAGAVFGVLLSTVLEGGINRFFQWRYDTTLVFVRITTRVALQSVLMAVPLGVLATVAGSWTLLGGNVFGLTRR
jgi:putative ABC transport system permease protein